jgi:NAD(P)-dependent dehydrogenase (short-subunit alcohol dehydrogenase family)
VRTVVVTGGARALYDETASALADLGADVRVLAGAGHRVQDDPRTTALLREVWTG